jgi:anti-sigma regulatory factor (Ser/Thr protein kinase)
LQIHAICNEKDRDVMTQGQQGPAPAAGAEWENGIVPSTRTIETGRASEREHLRARVLTVIIPGLEEIADPRAHPGDLIALAARHARSLRDELADPPDPPDGDRDLDDSLVRAREEEREWVRGHLHDTALQILEFIAGDGFGTGLSAPKIARLAGGAARDLRRWIDAVDEPLTAELVPELRLVTAEARSLDPRVELVVGHIGASPTSEQVSAIAGAVREAVTNARKHSHASHVIVRVETASDGRTAVTVTDDGVGIDPDLVAGAGGLGVKGSILGRMRRVGGQASLNGAPGGGTQVTLVTSRQGGCT